MRTLLVVSVVLSILISCQPEHRSESSKPIKTEKPYLDQLSEQLNYSLSTSKLTRKEIRIWIDFTVLDVCIMHSLKTVDSTTILSHYYMWTDLEDYSKLDSAVITFDKPTISTEQLITRIYELGFQELGSQPDSIASGIGDGIVYSLELRDSAYYKVIHYNIPHYFNDVHDQTFMNIINELESGLNWEYSE